MFQLFTSLLLSLVVTTSPVICQKYLNTTQYLSNSQQYGPLMLKGPDVPPVTVTKLTSYLPLNDQPIQYSSGSYFLYGQTNIYAIYLGSSTLFDNELGQNPSTTASSTMNGIALTQAIDEFLTYFGSSQRWLTTQKYFGSTGPTGTANPTKIVFKKSIRIDEASSFFSISNGNFNNGNTSVAGFLNLIFNSNALPNDPVNGVYVFVLAEGLHYLPSPYSQISFLGVQSDGTTETANACSFHDFANIHNQFYAYAMIGIPQQSYYCFLPMQQALNSGLTYTSTTTLFTSTVKRMSIMNSLAHELMELVTNPSPNTGWTSVAKSGTLFETADSCNNIFLGASSMIAAAGTNPTTGRAISAYYNVNYAFTVNGVPRAYLIQAQWDPVNQICV